MNKGTKKEYEEYLNTIPMLDEMFVIGGVFRKHFCHKGKYGSALRKHDPIAFEVGYLEWKRDLKYV